MVEFSLKEQSYSVSRPGLRKWLLLEELRNQSLESADKGEDRFTTDLFSYLSALIGVEEEEIVDAPWYEVLEAFYFISIECAPRLDFSILKAGKGGKKDSKLPDPWEYKERIWYSWLHTFCKNYGWQVDYVENLDVDDAIALIQEISLEEQFEREWNWSRSEVAYEYEKSTKKSKLRPLPRPDWMKRATKTVQTAIEASKPPPVRINPSFIPPGVIIYDTPRNKTADDERDSNPV